jgi:hypothetical protein
VPALCASLHFCYRTNENFTVLDIFHAWQPSHASTVAGACEKTTLPLPPPPLLTTRALAASARGARAHVHPTATTSAVVQVADIVRAASRLLQAPPGAMLHAWQRHHRWAAAHSPALSAPAVPDMTFRALAVAAQGCSCWSRAILVGSRLCRAVLHVRRQPPRPCPRHQQDDGNGREQPTALDERPRRGQRGGGQRQQRWCSADLAPAGAVRQ